jgi:methyl-accepting chemotaxis protein
MTTLFLPAVRLMGRLRYAYKIVLVPALLLVPLGLVTKGYVDIQGNQVSFSAKERDGLAYLKPLTELTARTVSARRLAVSGKDASTAGVGVAVDRVEKVQTTYGTELQTEARWTAAKNALAAAAEATGPHDAFEAYNNATAALQALIVQVSDKSNLTLDPDLDTYYLMDALVFRLPLLLDTGGQAYDRVLLARSGPSGDRDATRIELAIAGGALTTTGDAVDAGVKTMLEQTKSPTLAQAVQGKAKAAHDALAGLVDQITDAVRTGNLDSVQEDAADAAFAATAALAAAYQPQDDELIGVRIGGFEAKAHRVELALLLSVLVAGYLAVGFYFATTQALRKMGASLEALAAGDLTTTTELETRDELGTMGAALNRAIERMREIVQALTRTADGITSSSTEVSAVSSQLRTTAQHSSSQAESASAVAGQVSQSVDTVAASTEEMSASIREIAASAAEAATVAAEAVSAADATSSTVERLNASSADIGAVLNVITAIAEQTNLLALNATIEAARAGEAGRGFAVVAGEVKDLAQETARATGDIASKIETIQLDTTAAQEAITRISEVIGRIDELQSTIASAVEEQSAVTQEMGRSIAEVAHGSRQMADTIDGVASATLETTSGLASADQATVRLTETATELRELVTQFQT